MNFLTVLLVVIFLIIASTVGLAFYRGWFKLSSGKGKNSVSFSVDEKKITQDKDEVAKRVT